MNDWLEELFGTPKPIIAMCHLMALPGDPNYDPQKGLTAVVERARADLLALQAGGVDAVMFSNEFSLPYLTSVRPVTTACMARIITELYPELRVPFGVDVLWDPMAVLDLAVATGASFAREIFSGVYASDFGLWNTNYGEVARHRVEIQAQNVRLLFNIYPEAAMYLSNRDIADVARSTVFNMLADAVCVSGLTAGIETSSQRLKQVKEVIPDTPVFANTGVKLENLPEQLAIADGAVVGTAFKKDGNFYNSVDTKRVQVFMDSVRQIRESLPV
jgi:membrane complex biogenesis BtpA family protein